MTEPVISTYAWILIGSAAFPLLFSFLPRVAFWRRWPSVLASAALVAVPFVVWDIAAAARGDWAFSKAHTWTVRLWGLPVEEYLFFLFVPFACVFVHACLNASFADRQWSIRRWAWLVGAVTAGLLAVLAWPRAYSSIVLVTLAVFLLLCATLWTRSAHSRSFWLAQGLCLLPFLVVNGLLTGIPVVTYHPDAILGLHILNIPVEDVLYSLAMVGANIAISERFQRLGSPHR